MIIKPDPIGFGFFVVIKRPTQMDRSLNSMKIKEQTRKLAAAVLEYGKAKLTLFEFDFRRVLLDYNLPATSSNNSWILAWLLPPAMAMSGLPPPRPSTIGANSLTRFPA